MTYEQLQFQHDELVRQNKWLHDKLILYLNAKRKAIKTKDKRDFGIANTYEKEITAFVMPKQDSQFKIDWLAQ